MKHIQTATEQYRTMLRWLLSKGVDRIDLAVRRADTAFLSRGSADLDQAALERHIPWLRWQNMHGAEAYIRPARGRSWPVVFLDDVSPCMALRIADKYAALVVRTSRQGGCHVWLQLARPLDEDERHLAQAYLQPLVDADPASVSGEHWGRLAGTRNHKRGGQWIGVLAASDKPPWDPSPAFSPPRRGRRVASSRTSRTTRDNGRDESVAEFAWCCHCLRHGILPADIEDRLERRARERGKRNPPGYAARTLKAAMERLQDFNPYPSTLNTGDPT